MYIFIALSTLEEAATSKSVKLYVEKTAKLLRSLSMYRDARSLETARNCGEVLDNMLAALGDTTRGDKLSKPVFIDCKF